MAEPAPETQSFVGKTCMVLSQSGSWRECTIVAEKPGELLVHFDGFDSKYDEWLPHESGASERLRWIGFISDAEMAAWDAKDGIAGAASENWIVRARERIAAAAAPVAPFLI